MTRRQSIWSLAALSTAALIWASHNVAGAWLTKTLHPVAANLIRTNLASLLYIPILLRYKGRARFARNDLPRLVLAALFLAAFFQLFYWALQRAGAGYVAVTLALGPALTCALGVPYLGEKLTGRAVAGLIIALTSASALGFARARAAVELGAWHAAAPAFTATLAFAHYTLLSKPLLRRYPVPYVLGWTVCLGTVFLWLYVPVSGMRLAALRAANWPHWLALSYIALFMNVFSYILYNRALQKLPAGVTHAVTVYVTTLFALVMVRFVLNEAVPAVYWACAGAIALGVWLTATAPPAPTPSSGSRPVQALRGP